MESHLFLTGATGYIGASLLQKWLTSSGSKITLLVRGKRDDDPRKRINKVLAELFPSSELAALWKRMDIVEGDVSFDRFGLKGSVYSGLAARITHVIHCAAAARFDLELEEARKVNVTGADNALKFAGECEHLSRMDYIGTAYVAGKRKGIVRENELDEGQEHNNTYEKSKLEAEKLVREGARKLPVAILRPSIVICDSKTGRASNFNGFYRALRLYAHGFLKFLPAYAASSMDLVPVDYVTDAIFSISHDPESTGRCYHLTAGLDNGTSIQEIAELAAHHFGREKFRLMPPEEFNSFVARMKTSFSEEEQKMINEIELYMPYMISELKFDNANTRSAVEAKVPRVSDYFGKMAEYIMKNG
jgi:thioester reductase-like protein